MYSDEYNNEEMNEEYSQENNQSNSGGGKTKLLVVIAGIVLVVIIIVFLVSKNGNSTQQTPVTPNLFISSQKENLSINNNIMLSASVTNFQNAIMTWTSSNPDVATVDQNGLVHGINYGTAIITATYMHTNSMPYSVSCEVIVAEGNPNVPITDVRFQEGEIMISVGGVYNLPVIIEPSDGYRTNVSYTSSNDQIVSVDNEGKIKANSVGKVIVSLDFNGKYKDDINVNVVQETVFPQVFIPVTNIEFTNKLLKLKVGETEQLKYQVTPQDALTSYLKWASSDENVATVSNGNVSALSPGTTNITLTSLDGVTSGIMTLEVVEDVVYATGITANPTILDLEIGGIGQIVANITPPDATDKTVSYSSNAPEVASVDSNGRVTAISEGNAVITLTASGIEEGANPITTTVVVIVSKGGSSNGGSYVKVKEIKPSSSSITVFKGDTKTITSNISPSNASNKKISCSSSDTDIVDVNASGSSCTVTGKKAGNATITLKAKDGSEVTATVKVKVSSSSILVNSSYSVKVGNYVSFTPNLKSGYRVTSCSISDTSIARAAERSGDCSVQGLKEGSTTLTVKATNSDGAALSATTTIKVTKGTSSNPVVDDDDDDDNNTTNNDDNNTTNNDDNKGFGEWVLKNKIYTGEISECKFVNSATCTDCVTYTACKTVGYKYVATISCTYTYILNPLLTLVKPIQTFNSTSYYSTRDAATSACINKGSSDVSASCPAAPTLYRLTKANERKCTSTFNWYEVTTYERSYK